MTDAHANAVEAAALDLINQDRARFDLRPHSAPSEAFDEGRKAMGIATTAITAYLAAMREAGWMMVPREPTEAMLDAGQSPDWSRWETRGRYAAMIDAAMLKGLTDGQG